MKTKKRIVDGRGKSNPPVIPSQGSQPPWYVRCSIPALLVLIVSFVFYPVLQNGFVEWDDAVNFLQNPHYRGLGWEQISWMVTTFHGGHYQPLSWLTLGFDYVLWGMDPFGYHLTNLLIHAANTVLFYFISRWLLSIALSVSEKNRQLNLSAAFSALLFGIHPLRVESVAWVTERRDVLSGLFYLLTIYTYLRAANVERTHSRRWLSLACVTYALSLFSKGTAMTLPAILILLDIYPLRRFKGRVAEWFKPEQRGVWFEKVPFLILACGFAWIALSAQRSVGALKTLAQYELPIRLGQTFYGVFFGIGKSIFPVQLSPLYELPLLDDAWKRLFVLAACGALAITLGLYWARRRWPAALACWVYYIIVLSPVSGIAQSGPQLVADRYSYLACLSWAVLIGGTLFNVSPLTDSSKNFPWVSGARLSFVVVTMLSLGLLTWKQSLVWRDTRTLWQHAIAVTPDSSIAYYNLGKTFETAAKVDQAIEFYRRAVTINPSYANAHHSLADMLVRKGLPVEALAHYRKALQIKPDDAETHNNLGVLLEVQGEIEAALDEFQKAAKIDPNFARAFFNLGRVFAQEGDLAQATNYYREANRLDPREAVILVSLAEVLARQGNVKSATEYLVAAINLKADFADAHVLLARLLAAQGKTSEAQKHYGEAMRLLKAERNGGNVESAAPPS